MKSHSPHSRHDSAHGADWQVTRCACGLMTLRIGPIRIEFTPEEFAQLDRMVGDAMKRFEVAAGDAAPSNPRPLTH
jgi:hypothetical protein